jgi:hypothetical protein
MDMTKTQTLTISTGRLNEIRKGDRITSIDGRTGLDHTVTAPLGAVGAGTAQAIGFINNRNGSTGNLYPDSMIEQSVTVERSAIKVEVRERKNVTHINVGDRLIVETWDFGLRSTRRKTRVLVVTVTGKRKGSHRCYVLTTTGGEWEAQAAEVYGIA